MLLIFSSKIKKVQIKSQRSYDEIQTATFIGKYIIYNRAEGLRLNYGFNISNNFGADVLAEYTDKNNLHSDFSYAFDRTNLHKGYRLIYHSDLNIFAPVAFSIRKLVPQKWFDLGGKTFMNYHGNLRCVNYKTFTGDRMANSTIENSVNGSGFYDHGLKLGIIKALKLHFWSGIGWSSLSEKSKGFAVNVDTPTQTTDGAFITNLESA